MDKNLIKNCAECGNPGYIFKEPGQENEQHPYWGHICSNQACINPGRELGFPTFEGAIHAWNVLQRKKELQNAKKVCWFVDPHMINKNGLIMVSLISAWEKELTITSLRVFEPWNIVKEKISTLNSMMGVSHDSLVKVKEEIPEYKLQNFSSDQFLDSFAPKQRSLLDITFQDGQVIVFIRSTVQTLSLMEILSGEKLNNVLEMAKFYYDSLGHFFGLFQGQFIVERLHQGSNN